MSLISLFNSCIESSSLCPRFKETSCIATDCMLGGQPNHGWQLCFPLKLHADGSDFTLYDGSDLKTYLLMRWWGPDSLAVCRAHRGLPVGFLLLRYSVLFTVESLSLLYLLVIS